MCLTPRPGRACAGCPEWRNEEARDRATERSHAENIFRIISAPVPHGASGRLGANTAPRTAEHVVALESLGSQGQTTERRRKRSEEKRSGTAAPSTRKGRDTGPKAALRTEAAQGLD